MADTEVKELVINTLTHKQFKAAQEAGTLSPYELYGTPDTSVRLPVLTPMWFDHITNDVSWLRADTFSWQSGDVYVAAYEHLADDYENAEDTTQLYYLDLISTDKVYADGSAVTINGYAKSIAVGEKVFGRDEGIATITSIGNSDIIDETLSNVYDLVLTFDTGEVVTFRGTYESKKVKSSVDEIDDLFVFYRLTKDGHKICLPDQEAKISALYEATGVAWYYILDTYNKQFKLPRVNANKELLLTDVAPVVTLAEEHLTVGAPTLTWQQSDGTPANYQQYFTLSIGGTPSNGTRTSRQDGSNATGKSGISPSNLYADLNASRTLFGGKRHLYFYVGNFTQDSVEQTAGINAELFNNKADVDLGNIPANYDYVVETQLPAADNGYTWYRKYKSGWVEQGGELSGRSVTFPVEFAQIPTLVFGDYSSNSTSTPQNAYDEITTTGFTGWRTRTNAGWDSGAEDWNGYWQASGMSAQ